MLGRHGSTVQRLGNVAWVEADGGEWTSTFLIWVFSLCLAEAKCVMCGITMLERYQAVSARGQDRCLTSFQKPIKVLSRNAFEVFSWSVMGCHRNIFPIL